MAKNLLKVVGREVAILSSIFGIGAGSIAIAGYLAELSVEAKENSMEPPFPIGKRVKSPSIVETKG